MSSTQAFVISQIGADGSDVRRRADELFGFVVKPVTDAAGLVATRSDLDPTPGQITVQIIQSLTTAAVVIADLTGRNPNVFYELGVAHSFAIPVISLVDSTESLPFDMAAERVIEVGAGKLGVGEAETAKAKLADSLRVVLAEGYVARSLVSEAAQARSLDALAPDNPIAKEIGDMRDLLEAVAQQQRTMGSYRATANYLFDMLRKLAAKGLLNTQMLRTAGIAIDEAPTEGRVDLREALQELIPPPPFNPSSADDDIPF